MQNKYTCDIGDFGKYGLLRGILLNNDKASCLKLGVNWCLVPDEKNNNDGKFIDYLSDNKRNTTEFKSCDNELYCILAKLVQDKKRNIKEIQGSNILPQGTVYFSEPFSYLPNDDLKIRVEKRSSWLNKAFEELKDTDMVFFDPDNGLEVQSYSKYSSKSNKYVFYDELVPYFNRGQSLIIYNHRDRKPEDDYIKRISNIKEFILTDTNIFYLRFNRFSVRDYIFVLQPKHKSVIEERVNCFQKTGWAKHFKYYQV